MMSDSVRTLIEQRDNVIDALRAYVRHETMCKAGRYPGIGSCNCGLAEWLARARELSSADELSAALAAVPSQAEEILALKVEIAALETRKDNAHAIQAFRNGYIRGLEGREGLAAVEAQQNEQRTTPDQCADSSPVPDAATAHCPADVGVDEVVAAVETQQARYENAQCITCATHLDEAAVETPQAPVIHSVREQALKDALEAVIAEHLEEPNCAEDEAYDLALIHAREAIGKLFLESVARETPPAPSPQQEMEK